MKSLCTYIDSKNWKAETKYHVALLITRLLAALAGLVLWLIIRMWMFSSPAWLICFAGYPFVIAWFLGFIYLFRNKMHDGAFVKAESPAQSIPCSTPARS